MKKLGDEIDFLLYAIYIGANDTIFCKLNFDNKKLNIEFPKSYNIVNYADQISQAVDRLNKKYPDISYNCTVDFIVSFDAFQALYKYVSTKEKE